MAAPAKILVVDGSRSQADWLVQVLRKEGYAVATAHDGRAAIHGVRSDPPDLVLLEATLPDMDGLEVLRAVKAPGDERSVPVILLSVEPDLERRAAGLRAGADDSLERPFGEAEVLARCAAMLRIRELQEKLRDAQRRLEEQTATDALTGLRNRRFFDERLEEEFRRAQRYDDHLALVLIDLDHFEAVNERYGRPVGDAVLREAAALIRCSIRDPDLCVRYGGEEFAVLLPKAHMSGALAVAERIWGQLEGKAYAVHGVTGIRVTASLGVAFYPSKEVSAADLLLRCADQALHEAKRAGRNTICLHPSRPFRFGGSRLDPGQEGCHSR